MKEFGKYKKLCLWCGLWFISLVSVNFSCATSLLPPTTLVHSVAAQPTVTATIPSSGKFTINFPIITNQASEKPSEDVVWQMIQRVNRDEALADLRRFAGEVPICTALGCYNVINRTTGSPGLQKVKEYITEEFTKLGYTVEVDNWSQSGYSDQNLVIKKPGTATPEKFVYFVAHMDGIAKEQSGRYPGADDNASGAVDILELARVLSSNSFKYTAVFFLSTGEEQGSLGVKSYLGQLSAAQLSSIKYVVNIDTIGYDKDRDGIMQLFHGDHAASKALAQIMSDTIIHYQLGLTPLLTAGCP